MTKTYVRRQANGGYREGSHRGNRKHRVFLSFLATEEMVAGLNAWAARNNCNMSEALRTFVEWGLDAEASPQRGCAISHDAKTHTKRGTPRP